MSDVTEKGFTRKNAKPKNNIKKPQSRNVFLPAAFRVDTSKTREHFPRSGRRMLRCKTLKF